MGGKESKELNKKADKNKDKDLTDKEINNESDQPVIVQEDEKLNNEKEDDQIENVDEDNVEGSEKNEAAIDKQQEDEEYWGTADPYSDTRRKYYKPPVKLDSKKIEEEANKLDINKHLVTGFTRFHVNTGVLGLPTYNYNFQKINFKEMTSSDTRLKSLKKSRFSWQINDMDDEVY